jgi:hypothetical protein
MSHQPALWTPGISQLFKININIILPSTSILQLQSGFFPPWISCLLPPRVLHAPLILHTLFWSQWSFFDEDDKLWSSSNVTFSVPLFLSHRPKHSPKNFAARFGRPENGGSIPGGDGDFFSAASMPALGLTQAPIQWVLEGSAPRGKAAPAWW